MNEYVWLMTGQTRENIRSLIATGILHLITAVAVGLPKSSTIFYFGSCVCKNDKRIQSSKSLYQIEAACIQKAGSIATFMYNSPRYFLLFASKRNLILVLISTIFISGNQSHCHFFLYLIKLVLGTVPTLRLSALKLWLVFCLVPSCNLTMMLKETRESYF